MQRVDLAGYIASSLVFMTFYMRGVVEHPSMSDLQYRRLPIYAFSLHLAPIVILHGALIPVNVSRLIDQLWRADTQRSQNPVGPDLMGSNH